MHGDRCAGSYLAFGGNFSAGLLNDRVDVRKTQPRTLGFCRKEWLENSSRTSGVIPQPVSVTVRRIR
jgi:hypothetical protein